jgi:hypothetical protein
MDLRREPAPVRDVGLDIGYVFDTKGMVFRLYVLDVEWRA